MTAMNDAKGIQMVLASPEYDEFEKLHRSVLTLDVDGKLRWFNIYPDGVITLRASNKEGAVLETFGEKGGALGSAVRDARMAVEKELGIDCKHASQHILKDLRQGIASALVETGLYWSFKDREYKVKDMEPSLCFVTHNPFMGLGSSTYSDSFMIMFRHRGELVDDVVIKIEDDQFGRCYQLQLPEAHRDFTLYIVKGKLTYRGLAKVFSGLMRSQGFHADLPKLRDVFAKVEGEYNIRIAA